MRDKILFFDGYCALCNNLVDRMLKWDKNSVLKFASLQGDTARNFLPAIDTTKFDPDTIVYLRNDIRYDRSTAALLSLIDLGGRWAWLSVFLLVPQFLRDLVYRFIAQSRYRLFGKRQVCRVPNDAERERLLP